MAVMAQLVGFLQGKSRPEFLDLISAYPSPRHCRHFQVSRQSLRTFLGEEASVNFLSVVEGILPLGQVQLWKLTSFHFNLENPGRYTPPSPLHKAKHPGFRQVKNTFSRPQASGRAGTRTEQDLNAKGQSLPTDETEKGRCLELQEAKGFKS